MNFIDNWVWRRWAKRFVPRDGWVYDQNNGVTIVVPTITHQAWLCSERQTVWHRPGKRRIGRMPLYFRREGGGCGVHFLLFTDKEEYRYSHPQVRGGIVNRIDNGQAGTTAEFSLFSQHFVMEQASIHVPQAEDPEWRTTGHTILGSLQDPACLDLVIGHAQYLSQMAWYNYG